MNRKETKGKLTTTQKKSSKHLLLLNFNVQYTSGQKEGFTLKGNFLCKGTPLLTSALTEPKNCVNLVNQG